MLQRLKNKCDKGSLSDPIEIVKLDKQMKELKRRIRDIEGM
jgi:hypothetical protein